MKRYIVILIIVIILVVIIFNFHNKKEHYIITPTLEVEKINETVKQYFYNKENRQIENLNVSKDVDLLNKTLYQELVDFKYPVDSFYVQYADVRENFNPQKEVLFPEDKSPEKLFGGKWKDNFQDQGIFFRTGGKLSQEKRYYGLQEWAVKNMDGWTSWAQAHYTKPDQDLAGVFTKSITITGQCDDGAGDTRGVSNLFDSSRAPVNSSVGETRVKNRLIKVWRRIA